jgi:hypothetical protein
MTCAFHTMAVIVSFCQNGLKQFVPLLRWICRTTTTMAFSTAEYQQYPMHFAISVDNNDPIELLWIHHHRHRNILYTILKAKYALYQYARVGLS